MTDPSHLGEDPSPLVEVGRIVKPHGIRGEVVVAPTTDRLDRFEPGTVLHARERAFTIEASRLHQGRILVAFEGCEDRSTAERLRGTVLEAEARDASTDDTYLASELVGMAVVSEDGRDLGRVDALVELPAAAGYDLLEVRRADGTTWLLPAVEEYVEVGEDDDGRELLVVVSPPEGLVDGEAEVIPPSEAR